MRFIAYGDIHYDRLGAKCVTLQDCINVETSVHNAVVSGDFDFSLFLGDRFLKRDPEDEVKTFADRVLINAMYNRKQPHYTLIGNHDWVDRSQKWHTSNTLVGYPNIIVMDEPKTYVFNGGEGNIFHIHALPSGYKFDFDKYDILPTGGGVNLFVFHDMVTGCKLSEDGSILSTNGLNLADIDRSEFDLVLAGDIHIPQRLSFKNTVGGYAGSVLQRTRADSNCSRGWLEVNMVDNLHTPVDSEIEMRHTRGFFKSFDFEIDGDTTFSSISLEDAEILDMCIDIILRGKKEDVDRVAKDSRWANYEDLCGARSVNIIRKYVAEKSEVVIDMSKVKSLMDSFVYYIDSGFSNLGNLSRDSLIQIVRDLEAV